MPNDSSSVAPSKQSGILLVDKPSGMTSHDVVSRTRRLAGTRKVGHAGTLDPLATGLLVLGVNSSTRLLTYVVGLDKEYLATIRLGVATTTDDAEGAPVGHAPRGAIEALDDAEVGRQIAALTGELHQVPSSVSAIKVDGRRAYALVRSGVDVQLASRAVTVSEFEVLSSARAVTREGEPVLELRVRVVCSSGTYIRALARDLGRALDVGGHLTALRRTRIGPFDVADAVSLEDLVVSERLSTPAEVAARLFPIVSLTGEQTVDLGHGKRLRLGDAHASGVTGPVAALSPERRLVGLIEIGAGGEAKVLVNFPADEVCSEEASS